MKIFNRVSTGIIAAVFLVFLSVPGVIHAAGPATVDLLSADNFAILTKTGVTDVPTSDITGDVGASPITGAAIGVTCAEVSGTIYSTNTAGPLPCQITDPTLLTAAVSDMETAYTDAAGRTIPDGTELFAGNLGGQTLTPGLYKWSTSITIPTDVTLSGGASDVWIFQIAGDLNISSAQEVVLSGGAQASNIFWQVGGATGATLGTTSVFNGTILSAKQIILQTGATLNGRALSQTQVTLDQNTVIAPGFSPPPPSPATLHVIKTVINDNAGTAVAGDFSMHVTDGSSDVSGSPQAGLGGLGTSYSLTAGSYIISEDTNASYVVTFSGDCDSSGQITLVPSDDVTCIVTNNDIIPSPTPATINVVKTVINDNGRHLVVSDFPLFVNGSPVTSGATNTFPAPITYTVTETGSSQYNASFSGDCDSNGVINLVPGANAFCIVTNNDRSGGGGGGSSVVAPLIDVVKVPNPLALPAGPGPVTYTYTVRNIGVLPMTNITMVGDSCSPIKLISGDANNNTALDLTETWVYTCTTTLTTTHTNTIVATGWANNISATDIASATVIVGAPVAPPLIHVTKVPNPLRLTTGGMVTYTERLTNPGAVALSNVRLVDDKCAPVNYISGDTNSNAKLDVSETWTYICRMNLFATTTNTAIATGEANGLVARDFAIVTVIVATPGLPNTGFPDQARTISLVFGSLAVIAVVYAIRRKQHA